MRKKILTHGEDAKKQLGFGKLLKGEGDPLTLEQMAARSAGRPRSAKRPHNMPPQWDWIDDVPGFPEVTEVKPRPPFKDPFNWWPASPKKH